MIRRTKIRCTDSLHVVFSIISIFIFSGCQKVINVDLNEAAPHIVIEGLITDRKGPYTVTISKSGSYFNQPVLDFVSDAVVIITDNEGLIDTLKETNPGIYLTSRIRGTPGRTYTLKVLSENKEYLGSSTMYSHVGIDSLILIKSRSQHFGFGNDAEDKIDVAIHCFFKDPDEKNFYRLKVFSNDAAMTENYRLYDDQYTNGYVIGLRAAPAQAGHNYRIELYSLDKRTYGYYRTLEDILNMNPVFGSTPVNPTTNLNNGALGYFGACAVSSKTILITNSLLNKTR
jgi:hypothetical protein